MNTVVPCRCGSTTHARITHGDCPLNKRNECVNSSTSPTVAGQTALPALYAWPAEEQAQHTIPGESDELQRDQSCSRSESRSGLDGRRGQHAGKWQCLDPNCDQSFPTRDLLRNHMASTGHGTSSRHAATRQGVDTHRQGSESWICPHEDCRMALPTRQSLRRHLKQDHPEVRRPSSRIAIASPRNYERAALANSRWKCESCETAFSTRDLLRSHVCRG